MDPHSIGRRTVLAGALLAPLGVALTQGEANAALPRGNGVLVAYFTRSGNTKVIAGTLQRAMFSHIIEIRTAEPYPDDYEANVEQAQQERDAGTEPLLAQKVADFAHYHTIFLGFPIWGATTPPPIRSFLRQHDLAGKTVRPFITHGGYGIGDAMAVLKRHAPDAHIEEPFVMEADQERRTLNTVRGWLETISAT